MTFVNVRGILCETKYLNGNNLQLLSIHMRSMHELVRPFRLYNTGKKFLSVSDNMESVTWDTLKQSRCEES